MHVLEVHVERHASMRASRPGRSSIRKRCHQLRHYIFFFNDTATTEIYTLSLHDALPISRRWLPHLRSRAGNSQSPPLGGRSEEHTSELQSRENLVCRLLLEKKKN